MNEYILRNAMRAALSCDTLEQTRVTIKAALEQYDKENDKENERTFDRGTAKYQHAVSDFVEREVIYCVSCLIDDMAKVANETSHFPDYDELQELLYAYGTYQEAAEEEGWRLIEFEGDWYGMNEPEPEFCYGKLPDDDSGDLGWFWKERDGTPSELFEDSDEAYGEWLNEQGCPLISSDEDEAWEELCSYRNIEREQHEVFEHWIVTGWLAGKLRDHGETVGEWCNLTIWARCTTGQAISMDGVICDIYDDLHKKD